MAEDPFKIFGRWFKEAEEAGIKDHNAMSLATCTKYGFPSNRMVLLKDYSSKGFVFYTNMESRKGEELKVNPRAALCFFWQPLEKQVRIEGKVEKVADKEADAYFKSRALKSKIGAWVSKQSRPLEDPKELLIQFAEQTIKMVKEDVKRPPYWSGYRVVPTSMEFWQKGDYRLHTRRKFVRSGKGWKKELLYP